MKIAVFMNENNEVESFIKGKYLTVFIKDENAWKVDKRIDLRNCTTFGIGEMRSYFNSLTELISDIKIVGAKEAYGIPYNIFYSKDFSIWEMEGNPHDFLDHIMMKEIQHEEMDKEEDKKEPITKVQEGKYFIDLIELQNSNGMSSKQAMIPFLQSKEFNELEIKCCHIPLWLNGERKKIGFTMEVEEVEKDLYKVVLNNIN